MLNYSYAKKERLSSQSKNALCYIKSKVPTRLKRLIYTTNKTLALWKSRGHNAYCPCCDKWYGRFADYSRGYKGLEPTFIQTYYTDEYRLNSKCPNCGAVTRHRMLCDTLNKKLPLTLSKEETLVFSPSSSFKKWAERNNFQYTSTNYFGDDTVDMNLDIQKIDLPDESFAFIKCFNVLYCVDYRKAAAELFRILKQGGALYLSDPLIPKDTLVADRYTYMGQGENIIFGTQYVDMLKEVGFSVNIITGAMCNNEIRAVIGPGAHGAAQIYHCEKPIF